MRAGRGRSIGTLHAHRQVPGTVAETVEPEALGAEVAIGESRQHTRNLHETRIGAVWVVDVGEFDEDELRIGGGLPQDSRSGRRVD